MGDNFVFGGGAAYSTINPVVLAIGLFATLMVLAAPRKYLFSQIAFAVFLTPFGQQVNVGGMHFFVMRIILVAGILRLLYVKFTLQEPLFPGGFCTLDKLILLWAICRSVAVVALYQEAGALINQAALFFDAVGAYFLFRYVIQDEEDIVRATRTMAVVMSVLAVAMTIEYFTSVNVFSYIGMNAASFIREGRTRAQAVYGNSITAGSLGATVMPLFFWVWKSGRAKLVGVVGLLTSTTVVITSVASTALSAYVFALLALFLWPLRKRMRVIRWLIVAGVVALAMVMKAPIWYLLAKFDFVGGHGWDRAYLVDMFARHISDWWLIGTKDNVDWGLDTWDQCNQFVAEGLTGGVMTLGLFLLILSRGFGALGKARRYVEENLGDSVGEEWLFWCLGVALTAHLMAFIGVDYFDQTRVWWFAFLAMIPAAISSVEGEDGSDEEYHPALEATYAS